MSRWVSLSFLFLSLSSGCAQLSSGRTYLTEMEHDDAVFFSPREDFPVMAGDSGRDWISEDDRRARTPASAADVEDDRANRALKAELRQLEAQQSDDNLAFYHENKQLLSGTSQKIYFLKLSPRDRKEYLASRGIASESRAATAYDTPFEKLGSRRTNDVFLGMNKTEVLASLGKPLRVEVAGNPRNENERWLYRLSSGSKYIYFESGKVEGWE